MCGNAYGTKSEEVAVLTARVKGERLANFLDFKKGFQSVPVYCLSRIGRMWAACLNASKRQEHRKEQEENAMQ